LSHHLKSSRGRYHARQHFRSRDREEDPHYQQQALTRARCLCRARIRLPLRHNALQFEAFGKRDVAIKNEEAAGAVAAAASRAAARIAAYQAQGADLNVQGGVTML
jgi:hypothetical protein